MSAIDLESEMRKRVLLNVRERLRTILADFNRDYEGYLDNPMTTLTTQEGGSISGKKALALIVDMVVDKAMPPELERAMSRVVQAVCDMAPVNQKRGK